jgi:N utilization substance protein A
VGACVGVKGVRVQAVVRELGGERMDIIPFTTDAAVFIARALSPAKIERVVLNDEEKKATVLVPDDQLSLAIGKGGQNVRLAARLSGWGVDLLTLTQYHEQLGAERAVPIGVSDLPGVGPKIARQLEMAGFETVQDVARVRLEDLMAAPGIGKVRAQRIRDAALRLVGGPSGIPASEDSPSSAMAPDMEPSSLPKTGHTTEAVNSDTNDVSESESGVTQ